MLINTINLTKRPEFYKKLKILNNIKWKFIKIYLAHPQKNLKNY